MDADTTQAPAGAKEQTSEESLDSALDAVADALPAAPVDASSVEPQPRITVPPPVAQEAEPVQVKESVIPTPPVAEKQATVELSTKEKEEGGKTSDEKAGGAAPSASYQIPEGPRVDVSAATVVRMMGIASTSDLRVLEGRVDLLTSKVAAILTKLDRCLSMFGSIPTASDIGRLEVQLAAVKTMMKELFDSVGAPVGGGKQQASRDAAAEQSRKLREGIKTNTES